jgi:hypothetical protein
MMEKALVRADAEDRKPEVVPFEKNIEASYLFAGAAAKWLKQSIVGFS